MGYIITVEIDGDSQLVAEALGEIIEAYTSVISNNTSVSVLPTSVGVSN